MIQLSIYSRPGCHLCDQMKTVVQRVASTIPLTLEEIDVSHDADLERLYGVDIPVLMMEGRKVAKHRISESDLRRVLTARSGGSG